MGTQDHALAGHHVRNASIGSAAATERVAVVSRRCEYDLDIVDSLGLIGAALTMNGNYKDALPYHVECRTLRGYMLPADDVRIAGALFGQGVYHAEQGDQGSAEPFLDRALEIYVATLGPDHPSVAAGRCPSVGSTTRITSAIAPTICSEERCLRSKMRSVPVTPGLSTPRCRRERSPPPGASQAEHLRVLA